jgi:hypothetical protein
LAGFLFDTRSPRVALRSQARFGGLCLCAKIPDSQETETGSTETRFDMALVRREAKDSPLAGPFGRQISKTGYSHAVGKPAVNRCLAEIGSGEGEELASAITKSSAVPSHCRGLSHSAPTTCRAVKMSPGRGPGQWCSPPRLGPTLHSPAGMVGIPGPRSWWEAAAGVFARQH